MNSPILELENVSKRFGADGALDDLNLTLNQDEIVTLIGPSGCGKSTALRIVAGLETPDSGVVSLRGRTVTGNHTFVEPEHRDVGFVFQDLALFPHLTVEENVGFGLKKSVDDRDERLEDVLDLVGLTNFRDRYPDELSGGEKQRVALARSLVTKPSAILMDEPFTNLDKGLRERLRREVREILKSSGIPTLFVTHDQEEALVLGDRCAVMREGTVEQVDSPEEIVTRPRTRFVAEFLGPTEFLPARKTETGIETEIQTLPGEMVESPATASFDVMVRADDIRIQPTNNGESDGIVEDAEFLGGVIRYRVRLNSGRTVYSLLNHAHKIDLDTPVRVRLEPGHTLVGFAETSTNP